MPSIISATTTSGLVNTADNSGDLQFQTQNGANTITLPNSSGTFITTTGGVTPGTAGNVLTSNGTAWTSAAPAGGGKVLQVVSVSTTTKTTRQSTDWGDVTNLTASITPTSSSSKVLVLVTVAGLQKPSGNTQEAPSLRLLRGAIEIAAQVNIMYSAGSIGYFQVTTGFTYLDSPATTSSTTYKMQIRCRDANNGPVAVNTDNGGENSTITLLEIAV
jgi:hypothetical protein